MVVRAAGVSGEQEFKPERPPLTIHYSLPLRRMIIEPHVFDKKCLPGYVNVRLPITRINIDDGSHDIVQSVAQGSKIGKKVQFSTIFPQFSSLYYLTRFETFL